MFRLLRLTARLTLLAAALSFGFGAWLSMRDARAAGALYHIDQRNGAIDFSVDQLAGLFTIRGRFGQFHGDIAFDPAATAMLQNPSQERAEARIDVVVDARSVDTPYDDALRMLRSPDYFDVDHYPSIHFTGNQIRILAPDQFAIDGRLQIKDVTLPAVLMASVDARHADSTDYLIQTHIDRARFGMVANRDFVADDVLLKMHIRLARSLTP